ncbi:uncharacterized protein LOC132732619 [Ruditapes philippinarum]|uniref:uncharacterized protein LOC132732619 n=1 Tax=Ruditapes philippinarum TaxID=129788 RepID=UPI00295BA225|nr:uncharacterized protein LOC132732619 [Ruditapes philippinarum]
MSYITWFLGLIGFFALRTVTVDGYSRECDFNQTIFTPEGTTASFLCNFTDIPFLSRFGVRMEKTSTKGYFFLVSVYGAPIIHISYYDEGWKNRSNISIPSYSDDQLILKIDLNNVSMADNGTYRLRDRRDYACYILYVMRTRTEPSHSQEEHEPIYVFAHPQASLIKRPLTNATLVWLLDGKSIEQTASFIQQDGLIWIPRIRRGLNGRNVTYRAIQGDGRITEVNTTIKIRYGPSNPLILVPRRTHYNMVSGDTMPDITCTSECYPPCIISWGEHSKDNILSLGDVTTEDTGEYTCTARRLDGRSVEEKISVFVSDNSNFIIAIACLASVQAVMILATGLCTFFIYKRKESSCCHVPSERILKNKTESRDVTLQLSSVQGSENAAYEELKHETRNNVNNMYSETNLSITGIHDHLL